MSKLTDDLIGMAEQQARTVLMDLHQPLMPTWLLINAQNKAAVIGTPWRDEQEKEYLADQLRGEMRKRQTIAYSFVAEAWRATVKPDTDLSTVRASNQPDKKEVVMVIAVDGEGSSWRTWEIQRDWNDQITGLLPIKEKEGGDWAPEGWICQMLETSRR